ncbi:terminase small subunit [Macrococcoides caseolyticum]|uniref:terminase small subunit n=1 Tax=Macrococcoides caseolyticum TaxID=69966 RepID=UPI000C34DF62|nr:terminase small subunit [Macrococcus caseolyticus]PKE47248.1 terminase small subunit [Macrococcus caseolyticus]
MKLSLKQQKFADEYIINGGNATQAAIKAGYSEKYANTNANKLLQNTTIQSYIEERVKQASDERLMDVTEALVLSAMIARGERHEAYSKHYDHLKNEVTKEVTYITTPDFEERQRSIDHILKVHGAYVDKKEIELTGSVIFNDDID